MSILRSVCITYHMHLHNTQKNKLPWSSGYSEEHTALCLGHPAEFIGFIFGIFWRAYFFTFEISCRIYWLYLQDILKNILLQLWDILQNILALSSGYSEEHTASSLGHPAEYIGFIFRIFWRTYCFIFRTSCRIYWLYLQDILKNILLHL